MYKKIDYFLNERPSRIPEDKMDDFFNIYWEEYDESVSTKDEQF